MNQKRYSSSEKVRIIHKIRAHNLKHGRGGASMAVKRFGVAPMTISKWLNEDIYLGPSRSDEIKLNDIRECYEHILEIKKDIESKKDELASENKRLLYILGLYKLEDPA